MVFLDYDVRNFTGNEGQTFTYTIPYKALVVTGDNRIDDDFDGGARISVRHTRWADGSGNIDQVISDYSAQSTLVTCGSVVAESGDTLRVVFNDDGIVKVYIFRLPEAP